MRILMTILLLVGMACAQLPDAPQPAPTTCTMPSGNPCPAWLHKLIGQYPPIKQQYVYPTWQETLTGHHAVMFWSAQGLAVASSVADIEITHQGLAHHNCVEGNDELPQHPSRGHLYAYTFAFTGPVVGFDLLMRKLGIPIAPYAPALVAAGKHAYAAYQWKACY